MMHVGFEPSPILGAHRRLGDTWKMFKWQMSGRMGGRHFSDSRDNGNSTGSNGGTGNGISGMISPPPPRAEDLVSPDGSLRVL
jgi:hypothetical protein